MQVDVGRVLDLAMAFSLASRLGLLEGEARDLPMAIACAKGAAALPTVDELLVRIRSHGTVQKAITEAGLRGVRVP